MRVGLVIYGDLNTISGGYLYDRMLVQHLRAAGHTVRVISLPWRNYGRHLCDNLDMGLLRRLRVLDIDVLLEDELNHPSLAWANRRLAGDVRYPIISIVHHLRSDEAHSQPWLALYRRVEARYLRSVEGYIFNSRTTCDVVERLAPFSCGPISSPIPPETRFHLRMGKRSWQGAGHCAGMAVRCASSSWAT